MDEDLATIKLLPKWRISSRMGRKAQKTAVLEYIERPANAYRPPQLSDSLDLVPVHPLAELNTQYCTTPCSHHSQKHSAILHDLCNRLSFDNGFLPVVPRDAIVVVAEIWAFHLFQEVLIVSDDN